jgi:hypothetical protein
MTKGIGNHNNVRFACCMISFMEARTKAAKPRQDLELNFITKRSVMERRQTRTLQVLVVPFSCTGTSTTSVMFQNKMAMTSKQETSRNEGDDNNQAR